MSFYCSQYHRSNSPSIGAASASAAPRLSSLLRSRLATATARGSTLELALQVACLEVLLAATAELRQPSIGKTGKGEDKGECKAKAEAFAFGRVPELLRQAMEDGVGAELGEGVSQVGLGWSVAPKFACCVEIDDDPLAALASGCGPSSDSGIRRGGGGRSEDRTGRDGAGAGVSSQERQAYK